MCYSQETNVTSISYKKTRATKNSDVLIQRLDNSWGIAISYTKPQKKYIKLT